MNSYLIILSGYAQADIFNVEDQFEKYFNLMSTEAKNQQFEFFGSGSMILLLNSGSYYPI